MEIKALRKDSVSITEQKESGRETRAYVNSFTGRAELEMNCPKEISDEIYLVWGSTPTVEDYIPEPQDLEAFRAAKLQELSTACNIAIVLGCDVTLSDNTTAHFSLAETDQINLTAAVTAIQQGATEYPYHADGHLCRLFPAQDIQRIATAATAHKLTQTTYCNHLMNWARRAETAAELEGITYGSELPPDLAAHMEEVLGNVQGSV